MEEKRLIKRSFNSTKQIAQRAKYKLRITVTNYMPKINKLSKQQRFINKYGPPTFSEKILFSTSLLVNIGEATLPTIMAVKVVGHECSCSTLWVRALLAQALHLSRVIHLVVLQNR
jgi:hypothetical protein